ncbi:inositol oxygenase, partial [bacterium]|nr:inositol oxygenase [bacterium]
GEYDYLMNDHDREMFKWVKLFNPYDLYSKSPDQPDPEELKIYYTELIDEFFPRKIRW